MKHERGYSLIEVLAGAAIFTIFLFVLVGLQSEFLRFDRELRIQMFTHPAPLAVLARLQRDILDSTSYPTSHEEWSQSSETLLLRLPRDGGSNVVVWDFATISIARRLEFSADAQPEEWVARAVPQYEIGSFDMPGERVAVRVRSFDEKGRLSIDRIILPRKE